MRAIQVVLMTAVVHACGGSAPSRYFDTANRDDVATGGVKMIPISTPSGTFHVWTKRVGNHPTIKVLCSTVARE